jgi:hypothetical protein
LYVIFVTAADNCDVIRVCIGIGSFGPPNGVSENLLGMGHRIVDWLDGMIKYSFFSRHPSSA